MRFRYLWILASVLAIVLTDCSEGDGDSGPNISLSPTSIILTKTIGEVVSPVTIPIAVANPKQVVLYTGLSSSGAAIDTAMWVPVSNNEVDISVQLQQPSKLAPGVYEGSVSFDVCLDQTCTQHVADSPLQIPVQYTVLAATPITIDASPEQIGETAVRGTYAPTVEVILLLEKPIADSPYVSVQHSQSIVSSVASAQLSSRQVRLTVQMMDPNNLEVGNYDDTLTVQLCYTTACVNYVNAAPLLIPIHYSITPLGAVVEPDVTPLTPSHIRSLPHDVIDAEYSKALDAIVMVSSYPSNALYVYDINSNTETQLLLAKPPAAVSVGPDGLHAAVGHDALITYVDLTKIGQAGEDPKTILNVSAVVFDIVLDGRGYVHVFPLADHQSVNMHSVEVATNTESIGTGLFYEGEHARLHPAGDYIYGADNGVSPADIEKFDIRTVPTAWLYDSPYHGDYEMCGNLWFSENGENIYTACGNVFRSSTVRADDMVHTGSLQLNRYLYYYDNFQILSLSQSDTKKEIAVVTSDKYNCIFDQPSECFYTHLNLYESDFLGQTAVYSFAPMTVNGIAYGQLGLFVFHSADSSRKFTISRLFNMEDPHPEYYLSEL